MQVTGRWGLLIHELGRRCRNHLGQAHQLMLEFEQEVREDRRWHEEFGIVPQALPLLCTMAEMDEAVSAEDLGALADIPADTVERILRWGELIAHAQKQAQSRYLLDPIVAEVAKTLRASTAG